MRQKSPPGDETASLRRPEDPPTEPFDRRDRAPDALVTPPAGVARGTEPPETRAGVIVSEDPTTMSGTYAFGEVIGRGGMGEVLLAHDRKIGRDVAVKRLRNASPT